MHRDLKPENILLSDVKDFSATLKIVDFGLSKKVEILNEWAEMIQSKGVGTPAYAAPEILNKQTDYDYKVDLWSLGLVLFEMLFGKHIFESAPNMKILQQSQQLCE